MERALPVYPQGFPPEVIDRLIEVTGRQFICNLPYNGLAALEDFGSEHLRTGALILYTSQDSVLQLAAHIDRVSVEELYRACEAVRAAMSGEHAVGRVIARPFTGPSGAFVRTPGRRDFAVPPPGRSYLDELSEGGVEVHGVGKISDLFTGRGIASSHPGATNARALASIEELLGTLEHGLVFANLVETDQVHGHRKDVHGFAAALREIDGALGAWLGRLRAGDLLIITADHGVDPAHPGSDHTREYVPLLAVTHSMLLRAGSGARHDGPMADVGATVLRWLAASDSQELPGQSFLGDGAA
jgi:phosphopentomutase